jgi:O-Antigen ligase
VRTLSRFFLGVVAVFLILGNAPRFVPIGAAFGNANVGEVALYLAAIVYLAASMFTRGLTLRPTLVYAFLGATLASLIIGILKWEIDAEAVIYNLRFSMQLLTALAIGQAMACWYGSDVSRVVRELVWMYLLISAMGLALFLVFPESTALWAALAEFGIEFGGDPHIGRLVSFYFDPNYFGTIIVLPIVLLALSGKSGYVELTKAAFLLLCLALTTSRSGISTLVLCGLYVVALKVVEIGRRQAIPRFLLFGAPILLVGLALLLVVFQDYVVSLTERFTTVSTDASANQRLESFRVGNQLIGEEPLLGFGYNYGLEAARQHRGLGLDSSLQTVVLNYGMVLSALMFVALALWARARYLTLNKSGSALRPLWEFVFVYFAVCMLWSGNFNQLLFYPFWLVPVFGLFAYIDVQMGRERRISAGSAAQ